MSAKKTYGIYLSYAPTVDLRKEGLGRYLASFLKGAASREDVRFIILCPSWSRDTLAELFAGESVPSDVVSLYSPNEKPWVLKCFNAFSAWRRRERTYRTGWLAKCNKFKDYICGQIESKISSAYGFSGLITLILLLLLLLGAAVTFSPLLLMYFFALFISKTRRIFTRLFNRVVKNRLTKVLSVLEMPKKSSLALRLYREMERAESGRMFLLSEKLGKVHAWYCPTAFWPAFNQLSAPKLLCVPDVVLSDFPIDFSGEGGDILLNTFNMVESSIRGASHFVTYSQTVKWLTLVDKYAVSVDSVHVVHHAPSSLANSVSIQNDKLGNLSKAYCQQLLMGILHRKATNQYISKFKNANVEFIFYASQLRPNKNVMSLLRAYNYLLRKRLCSFKLILTGNLDASPELKKFINDHKLQNDVLFLNGLTVPELAACYKLALLAVNPSLSEGGCPFTFTEALSVNTPIVMSQIPVSEEILTDPELQEMTFFDPYDWRDMANKIEWALQNRDELLNKQLQTYEQLSKRTWTDVVNEHIDILERISVSEK